MKVESSTPIAPSAAAEKRNLLMLLVKIATAVLVIALLLAFKVIDLAALAVLPQRLTLAGLALALFFLTMPLSALRWWTLLRAHSIRLSFKESFRIVAIGQFFNTFMPGAIGGDAIRFYYLFAAATGKRTAAATSLLMDRVLGLGGLLAAASLIILVDPVSSAANSALRTSAHMVLAIFMVAMGGAALAIVAPEAPFRHVINPLRRSGHLGALALTVIETLGVYRHRLPTLAAASALSFVIQVITLVGFVTVAEIFAFPGLGRLDYALASSIAIIANQLPITPGGIGIGEGAFDVICRAIAGGGAAPYATIFFSVRGLSAIASLYGAIAWISFPSALARK